MRVGGFAWEFKINPKRPQKKIKDDIEERETQRNKKQQPKASKRGPKEFQEGFGSVKKDFGEVARRNARGRQGGL